MDRIKQTFEEQYSEWDLVLPEKNFKNKKAGFIQKNGWLVQYCFGQEDNKEYMDIYAEHRMTNPCHIRIYDNGDIKELSHYQIAYAIDKDEKITQKNKAKLEEHNRKIAEELIEKGFNQFTINGVLLAGFAGNEDNTNMAYTDSPFFDKQYEQKYTVNNLIEKFNSKQQLDYVFFWQADKNVLSTGCFSQWQKSNFIVEDRHYSSAEQYMMGQKALLFNDFETMEKILSTTNPKQIKALGREVKNFNANEWDNAKYSVVLNGNFYKFTQNEEMLKILISTENKILVEASPFDKIWGIGLSEDEENVDNPNHWKGQNLLGFALMEVRDAIKKDNKK